MDWALWGRGSVEMKIVLLNLRNQAESELSS